MLERHFLSPHCRLFLKVHRDSSPCLGDIRRSYSTGEGYLRQTWHTKYCHFGQWATVLLKRVVLFSKSYKFVHNTSSPKHPQGEWRSRESCEDYQNLLKKSNDPFLALMAYRATPLKNGYSLAELLMGRKLRTTVPINPDLLRPKLPDFLTVISKEAQSREKQKKTYDIQHKAREPTVLTQGHAVWIPDMRTEGTIQMQVSS